MTDVIFMIYDCLFAIIGGEPKVPPYPSPLLSCYFIKISVIYNKIKIFNK